MLRKKTCVAMLLAGGQGSRLGVLTKKVAKPAVPYGGKYRIIDFPLSNCTNSGIDTVGVLTQYMPLELNAYIGSGAPWDLDLSNGGVFVLPPYQTGKTCDWYRGTANAMHRLVERVAEETASDEPNSLTLVLSYCNCPERAAALKKDFLAKCRALREVVMVPTGGISTVYAFDGGVVIAF